MNEVTHRKLVITYDIWQPFNQVVDDEEGKLIADLKDKKILHHTGNIKMYWAEEEQSGN